MIERGWTRDRGAGSGSKLRAREHPAASSPEPAYRITSGASKTAMAHTIASATTPLAHVKPWTSRRRTEAHPQMGKRGGGRLPDRCADWGGAALHESCSLFAVATDARTRRVCSG